MLFCSNFNGTWDQYIDAFADGIPERAGPVLVCEHQISRIRSRSRRSRTISAHNQIDTNYYYNATPGAAQRDIKAALRGAREAAEARRALMPAATADGVRSQPIRCRAALGCRVMRQVAEPRHGLRAESPRSTARKADSRAARSSSTCSQQEARRRPMPNLRRRPLFPDGAGPRSGPTR